MSNEKNRLIQLISWKEEAWEKYANLILCLGWHNKLLRPYLSLMLLDANSTLNFIAYKWLPWLSFVRILRHQTGYIFIFCKSTSQTDWAALAVPAFANSTRNCCFSFVFSYNRCLKPANPGTHVTGPCRGLDEALTLLRVKRKEGLVQTLAANKKNSDGRPVYLSWKVPRE